MQSCASSPMRVCNAACLGRCLIAVADLTFDGDASVASIVISVDLPALLGQPDDVAGRGEGDVGEGAAAAEMARRRGPDGIEVVVHAHAAPARPAGSGP